MVIFDSTTKILFCEEKNKLSTIVFLYFYKHGNR